MARVSFVVRGTGSGSVPGSYLRYPDGSASVGVFPPRTDYDSAIRADGLNLAPATNTLTTSSFSAQAVTYGSINLEWSVPLITPTSSPSPTSVLLVYSPVGIPQTIASGTVLIDSATTTSYTHTDLTQGVWAYYGLFVHYTTEPKVDDYYEKVAELEELVPTDYGTILKLWEQIPNYAKTADIAQGDFSYSSDIGTTHGDKVGPLFKFLSIIGFDMDRIRTMVDYLMVAKDPLLANSESLDAIAQMVGIDLRISDLGDKRLRSLLDDIGTFRRSKGTLTGLSLFAKAISGSNITLNDTTKKFTLFSQRVNYITVPKTGTAITTWRVAHSSEINAPLAFAATNYNAASAGGSDVALSGQTWTLTPNAHGIVGARIKLSSPIPVKLGDFVQFSVHSSTPQKLTWVRLTDISNNLMGWGRVVANIGGISYVEVDVTAFSNTATFTNGYIDFMVDLTAGPFVGNNYLAEANYLGSYFDGDTVRGGWLIDASTISDYRWAGSANNSVSIYAEDYKRTQGVVSDLFTSAIPITQESRYAIQTYNGIRGVTS
jgi:hypothetical protein